MLRPGGLHNGFMTIQGGPILAHSGFFNRISKRLSQDAGRRHRNDFRLLASRQLAVMVDELRTNLNRRHPTDVTCVGLESLTAA